MLKISLINMPFADVVYPSIALTQLKSVAEQRFGERVRVRVFYLNQDFARYLGPELYDMLKAANTTGLGDWFFRHLAFPEADDNSREYFQRYLPQSDAQTQARRGQLLAKRAGVERLLKVLIARHRLDQEDLIGLTSMFAQNLACFSLARMLKAQNPKILTVMGGANCDAPMGPQIARYIDAIDLVCSGASLVSFPELVGHVLEGEVEECHKLQGVSSRESFDSERGGGSLGNGPELPIEVPVPLDYESFLQDFKRNFPSGQYVPSLMFETSRGCWWGELSHCTFCGLNGTSMAYRAMAPEQALELFQQLLDQYGDRCWRFNSVDNILPREYLRDVFPKLDTPPGIEFFYEVKADLKAREMEIMANAGVIRIQPGVEALSSSTLKLMGKGTTAFQNVYFLKNCIHYGITPIWNLLIGFPGETEEVYRKYLAEIPSLVHLPPPSGAHPVRFDRYSPYFVKAAEYGLDLSPYDFYRFLYPIPEAAIRNLAYYFEDQNYNARYMVEMIAWQDKLNAAVERWQAQWQAAKGQPGAELRMHSDDGSTVIHDSRSGELIVHRLSALGLDILRGLHAKGRNLRFLGRQTGAEQSLLEDEIGRLKELNLLFEENGRWLSLVLEEERESDASQVLPRPEIQASTRLQPTTS